MFDECIEFAYITGKEIILTGDFNIDELARNKKKHCSSRSLKNMYFDQLVKEVTKPIRRTCLAKFMQIRASILLTCWFLVMLFWIICLP